jgi:hypothetical protein
MIFSKDYKEFEKHVLMLRHKPHFINDEEKMSDFFYLSKEEFLSSYSYLTEEEYDNTKELFKYFYEAGFIKVKVVNSFDFKGFKDWVMSRF